MNSNQLKINHSNYWYYYYVDYHQISLKKWINWN